MRMCKEPLRLAVGGYRVKCLQSQKKGAGRGVIHHAGGYTPGAVVGCWRVQVRRQAPVCGMVARLPVRWINRAAGAAFAGLVPAVFAASRVRPSASSMMRAASPADHRCRNRRGGYAPGAVSDTLRGGYAPGAVSDTLRGGYTPCGVVGYWCARMFRPGASRCAVKRPCAAWLPGCPCGGLTVRLARRSLALFPPFSLLRGSDRRPRR